MAEGMKGVGGGWSEGSVFGGQDSAAGHEGFVNAVEWIPGMDGAEGGAYELVLQRWRDEVGLHEAGGRS